MKRHARLDARARELARLHALGELSVAEAANYQRHLEDCPTCRAEAAASRGLLRRLAAVAPETEPSDLLFEKLLTRARQAVTQPVPAPWRPAKNPAVAASAGMTFIEHRQRVWEASPFAGIEVSQLTSSPDGEVMTLLVRMAAGVSYPAHRHGSREECLLLEGELRVGDRIMRAGDYVVAEPGSLHQVQSTERGCILLLMSALRDEFQFPDAAGPV